MAYPCVLAAACLALVASAIQTQDLRSSLPPAPCTEHDDCTDVMDWPRVPGICSAGQCITPNAGKPCTDLKSCGLLHSCFRGTCQLGTTGAPCRIDLKNCMNGFVCDAKTEKCIPGLPGSFCRNQKDCTQGHSCFLARPLPNLRQHRKGTCRPGLEKTYACIRDSDCAKGLVCRGREGNPNWVYQCQKPVNYKATAYPNGFAKCATSHECSHGSYGGYGLWCVNGRCQPQYLNEPCPRDGETCRENSDGYAICSGGKCVYRKAGDPCDFIPNSYSLQCPPGLQCTGKRMLKANRYGRYPGKCVRGVEGSKCIDGLECADDLICGTNKTCVKSAEGQRCLSNFWCPATAICRKSTRKCTFKTEGVPFADILTSTETAKTCSSIADCGWRFACLNGLCLPFTLGRKCSNDHFPGALPGCGGGSTCVNGTCVVGAAGRKCKWERNCYYGKACMNGTCVGTFVGAFCAPFVRAGVDVGFPAGMDIQCPAGTNCVAADYRDGKLVYRSRYSCTVTREGSPCVTHSNCPPGLECVKDSAMHPYKKQGKCAKKK